MCTPWSQFGQKQGGAHPATESWNIWLEDLRHPDFDLSFCGNSPQVLVGNWGGRLEPKKLCNHATIGPHNMGWPTRRFRLVGAAVNGEPDRLESPSAKIVMGQLARQGTGAFGLRAPLVGQTGDDAQPAA